MEQKQALLLVNRNSLKGENDLAGAVRFLKANGIHPIVEFPENPSVISGLIHKHSEKIELIITAGGDGTVHGALKPVLDSRLPLGIIPLGTANDLARTLQIPGDPLEACRIIVQNRVHRIDLGTVNRKYFLNVAHIGLGVRATRRLSSDKKRYWGVMGYLVSLIAAYRESRVMVSRITCDGRKEILKSIQIAVGNGRHYGGFMTIAEDAKIDDHLLNLYSLEPQSFWKLARLASAARRGRIQDLERTLYMKGRSIDIETDRPMLVVADGEVTTRTPAHFEVLKHILPVFVPFAYLEQRGEDHA